MFALCPWRRSESVEPTSPRGNTRGSGNSGADAFLITAPLSHTPPSTLRSTNTLHLFAVPRLRRTYERSVHSIRKVLGAITFFLHGLFPRWPIKGDGFHNTFPICTATPLFGDRSTAATWSKELQGSRTEGPCRSSTPWRATWGRGDERPLLCSTRTKRSAPSPHSQGA